MTDPIFETSSPRFALPLLFAGQAQKEGHVNEALARLDALLHLVLEGQLTAPPSSPQDGQCWLVGSGATGAWNGKAGQLACFCSGSWLFAQPRDGMIALDRQAGQIVRFAGGWHQASRPAVKAALCSAGAPSVRALGMRLAAWAGSVRARPVRQAARSEGSATASPRRRKISAACLTPVAPTG